MSYTPTVAGCDYSLKAIHLSAVRGREVLFRCEYALGRDVASQIGVISGALDELRQFCDRPSVLWMEAPWIKQGFSNNSALELHKIPTRVETLAVCAGFLVSFVAVATWRAQILGNGRLQTDAAKAAAIRYVSMVYGLPVTDHNEADSIALASYGASVAQREAAMQR